MAIVSTVEYHCGCEFKTPHRAQADAHAEKEGHCLTAQGTIRPVQRKVAQSVPDGEK